MKTTNRVWMLVCLPIFLTACNAQPDVINHAAPDLTISFEVFRGVDSPSALGCDEIQMPSNLLGGLEPSYPIAVCVVHPIHDQGSQELQAEIESGGYFYYTGGLLGSYVRYVIHKDGAFMLLKTEEEFRQIFAPIESPEEALSYALAVRNVSAYYGLAYLPGYKYEVDRLEDTYVSAEPDGYRVHLFYDQVFGCGPHWTSAVDVHVSADGTVEESASMPLFRDPNTDDLCVD